MSVRGALWDRRLSGGCGECEYDGWWWLEEEMKRGRAGSVGEII